MRPTLAAGTVGLVVSFLCAKGPKWLRLPWWAALLVACVAAGGVAVAVKARARTGTTPDFLDFMNGTENGSTSLRAPAEFTVLVGEEGSDGSLDDQQQRSRVEKAEVLFTELLVLTGCTVAFAHGGNDVGNREQQTGGSGGSLEPPGPLA
jgi:phosphate/sulfate permease